MGKIKAISMFSGGLDSLLSTRLVLDQGIDVLALYFLNPFCPSSEGLKRINKGAKQLGVPLKKMKLGANYLKRIRNPKYGYGRNLNPCIDCRIFLLKKAKKIAQDLKFDFIFTGEVLNERPMSQNKQALKIIEREAGLENKILKNFLNLYDFYIILTNKL